VTQTLETIRECFEGVVPGTVATCSADGVPNVCYLSQVEYVDREHVALSFQFFNKTRANVLANPHAVAAVVDPDTAAVYRLNLRYLRTETQGPVFERMKAKLASIASATGLSSVFKLQGSDIYRVERIERMPGRERARSAPQRARLLALRACSDALARAADLDALLLALLAALAEHFGIQHSMVLALDAPGQRFFAIASRGYGSSGVGAEIPVGMGAVGIAAARKQAIRVAFANAEYAYTRAIRERAAQDPAWARKLESEIPMPGLAEPHSQLAVPIEAGGAVLGVLYVESAEILRFTYEDEDALVALCRQVALAMRMFELEGEGGEAEPERVPAPAAAGPALVVRHYGSNDSVFLGEEYLIKGVAGAILRKLVRAFIAGHRGDFTNKELRLDKALGLPEIGDNLESRLVLLQRRLTERDHGLRIEKAGRGRFRLAVDRGLELVELP
jgi:adenylate cyclase